MKIWNYIGEFFLFRWLLGSHNHNEAKLGNDCSRYDPQDYDYSQSYNDFHDEYDEYDDYDMIDDDF